MKISKIYSNNDKFREIDLSDGMNIILGRVTNKTNLDSDSHNLGKSTLIGLIDFMFLKELDRGNFLKDNSKKFDTYIFFMELKKSESDFITIKRSVKNNTKISLKFHQKGKQDFRECSNWDYKDIPLTTTDTNKNPKDILNRYWGMDKIFPYNYRQYINYFLRTQYDYDEVFKLSKFKGKDVAWKPAIAHLLGFNGDLIKEKYNIESNIAAEQKLLDEMEKKLKISLNDLNQIESLLEINEAKKQTLQTKIDNFDFYLKERELNRELIEEVETKISYFNSEEYKLKYEVQKIKESIKRSTPFDIQKVRDLFSEIKVLFPNQLEKEYTDLIKFNNEITEERNHFLKETLENLEEELDQINMNLIQLNERRNKTLAILKEKDSFAKFKVFQMGLVEIENEISNLLSKISNYDVLKKMNENIKSKIENLKTQIEDIEKHLKNGSETFKKINLDFSNLVDEILAETAVLYYEMNTAKNIEFKAKIVSIEDEKITSKSEGYSYRKMLCVCFDLAVLLNYNIKEFYQFVYHDGSLESMSNTKKIRYIDKIRKLCSDNDIQYIFTALEDDIPRNTDGSLYEIDESEIAIILDDRENNKGRLFGMSF